jgi:hypothetical protein
MHPVDKDNSIGKRVKGGAQARIINIGKRTTNRPACRYLFRLGQIGGGGVN